MNTSAAASRVILVEDTTRASLPSPRIRRYRLARVQVNPRPGPRTRAERFAHLKRTYD